MKEQIIYLTNDKIATLIYPDNLTEEDIIIIKNRLNLIRYQLIKKWLTEID